MRYLFVFLALAACAGEVEPPKPVLAVAETTPVASIDDAADDAAIWVDPVDPSMSLIIGTDKQAGLYVYDLTGGERQFLEAGAPNNIDLRQGRTVGDWSGDIAAASNRADDTISLFSVSRDGVAQIGGFPSALIEPYGICLGVANENTYVFVSHKSGDLVTYRLNADLSGEETGRHKFASQLEGCVFDDEAQVIYVGEEARGVWKAPFTDERLGEVELVDAVDRDSGMKADVEGVALYKTGERSGYLLVSSQGNNSFTVYDREGANPFLGRFAVVAGDEVDGTEETDGIEAVSAPLGADFPQGVFIAQDGFNAPDGSAQNFKIVDWRAISQALALEATE